jgi:hypothetical protein
VARPPERLGLVETPATWKTGDVRKRTRPLPRRRVAIPVAILLCLGAAPASADVWLCQARDGSVTMADRKLKGMRCSLFSKGPAELRPALAAGASPPTAGGPGTPSNWRPRGAGATLRDEPADQRERETLYLPWIAQAAEQYDLPVAFVRAVVRVESNFRNGAKSDKGAMGLMQLMPSVVKEMGVVDPWEPRANILGGAKLLRRLADRFEGDIIKVLSAYHAGSGAVKASDGIPWEATESYVRRVLDHYYRYVDAEGAEGSAGDAAEDGAAPDPLDEGESGETGAVDEAPDDGEGERDGD